MTKFHRNGSITRQFDDKSLVLDEKLAPGTYTLCKDMQGYYLEDSNNFEIKGKIYGNVLARTDRILNTFEDRDGGTGCMFSGEKGSGKTLLAKNICIKSIEKGMPVIIVNEPHAGSDFNQFVANISQPCVFFFDEFEKVYFDGAQAAILTLLDGVYNTKKLFLLTCNDKYAVNSFMHNRPGRLFYKLDFAGLDTSFIREYCEDNLEETKHIDSICKIAGMFNKFTFDMLQALIQEMNRYNEAPLEAMSLLNISPDSDGRSNYTVQLMNNGEKVDPKHMSYADDNEGTMRISPLTGFTVGVYIDAGTDDADDDEEYTVAFKGGDIYKISGDGKTYHFRNGNYECIVTKKEYTPYNWTEQTNLF